jgi:hypothetical protein
VEGGDELGLLSGGVGGRVACVRLEMYERWRRRIRIVKSGGGEMEGLEVIWRRG